MIYLDSESVGRTGPLVTIQWRRTLGQYPTKLEESLGESAYISGVERIVNIWNEPISRTLRLIEEICNDVEGIVGFNLAHDWFVLNKWYNILRICIAETDLTGGGTALQNRELIKKLEQAGPQDDDVCLKPVKACDLMLVARAGKFQHLAKHKPIVVRKVPRVAINSVINLLSDIKLPIGSRIRWRINEKRQYQRKDVVDILGEFTNQSTSLKYLSSIVLNDPSIAEEDFESAVGKIPFEENPDWKPWGNNYDAGLSRMVDLFDGSGASIRYTAAEKKRATEYALNDVKYTYELWKYLGCPEPGDDDSNLACLVGATQWKGFAVAPPDVLMAKKAQYGLQERACPIQCNSPTQVLDYLHEYLDPTERMIINDTKKTTLEELGRWQHQSLDGTAIIHPVVEAVKTVQNARRASKRADILSKLLKAGRFTFSMKVLGTLSSRMAGGSEQSDSGKLGKLNPQGIPREKEFRSLFPLAFGVANTTPGCVNAHLTEHLEGGDFDAFEAAIAATVYADNQLYQDVLDSRRLKDAKGEELGFHAITGSIFYNCTPEEIKATKGTTHDKYVRSKNGFFGWLYGAHLAKCAKVLDLEESETEAAYERIKSRYPAVAKYRQDMLARYTPLRQTAGRGSKIEWVEPDQYAESLLGFRRYFDLEWSVLRGLYGLADNLDSVPDWKQFDKLTIRRTDREQSVRNAIKSALFAAIFSLQGHVFRAAANHYIQAVGAQLTKGLQAAIWQLQPSGVKQWVVRPLNIHDEVLCPTTLVRVVEYAVHAYISKIKEKIPLASMEWKTDLRSWADK